MTVARPAAPQVETVTAAQHGELTRLVARDPLVNVVIHSRLLGIGGARYLGGELLAIRDAGTGALRGAAFDGGNLVPLAGGPAEWTALARHVTRHPRRCTSIVGRVEAVGALWAELEPRWGPPRAVRAHQPLLALRRGDPIGAAPDPRVRPIRPDEVDAYLPAAAAMFTEELGISPYAGRWGGSYRRRVEFLVGAGRALGIRERDGRIAFKADLGAVSPATAQVQGVWTRPDLRGRGLGTAAMAAVLRRALQLAPTVSLYVNDFNTTARRMYARLGMRPAGELATILF